MGQPQVIERGCSHPYRSEPARIEGIMHDTSPAAEVDLIVRKARPFSREEFDRREVVDFRGLQLAVATIEDVISGDEIR